MARYLFEVSYTLDGVRGLVAEGGSARRDAAKAAIESGGGTMETFDFAFGGSDVYVIADLPDAASAAGFALTITAAGGVTARTIVLLTPEEIDTATKLKVGYRPPGS